MNCIIVPVYKEFNLLTNEELISLCQLFKVLGSYKIFLVGPENLQYDTFLKEAQKRNVFVRVKRFSDEYFYGIEGYNKLMMSFDFYQKFRKFKYALIYQLDAYVFRDELKYWCNKGYDYVGAPWNGMHTYNNKSVEGVGNGGFSLRKIKSSIGLLEKIRMYEVLIQYQHYNWKGLVPKLPFIIKKLGKAKKSPSKCETNYHFQEDYFWCNVAPASLSSFPCHTRLLKLLCWWYTRNDYNVAPKNIAVSFSLETSVRELFEKNNNTLPFGCHAWEKYEPDFWKEFIPMNELVK
jgi:hypothetical protein